MKKLILIMCGIVFLSGCTYSYIGEGQSFVYKDGNRNVMCSTTPSVTDIEVTNPISKGNNKSRKNKAPSGILKTAETMKENKLTASAINLCSKILEHKN